MTQNLQQRVKLAKCKLRNIIYYRLEVEPTVPERFRAQYMHVLREFRKEALELVSKFDDGTSEEDYKWLSSAIKLIPPKVKTEECIDVIKNLVTLFTNEGK